jgi:hypothetical protein
MTKLLTLKYEVVTGRSPVRLAKKPRLKVLFADLLRKKKNIVY